MRMYISTKYDKLSPSLDLHIPSFGPSKDLAQPYSILILCVNNSEIKKCLKMLEKVFLQIFGYVQHPKADLNTQHL